MIKNPNARIVDPHAESRAAKWQARVLTNDLKNLLGEEQAQLVAEISIQKSLNDRNQLNPTELVRLLELEVSKARLISLKKISFHRYCTIRNIAHYDRKGRNNKKQIIGELLSTAGYASLDQLKAEYPHLWNRSKK